MTLNAPAHIATVECQFVDLWGTMSSLWGINPTMARIHGLLFITGESLTMDDMMDRLGISRGNVSMNLSKLVEWGLVRRVHKRGDRRDYYDPRNSLLHEVMSRRLGIPLTLSILFMELGWRIGMPFEGVGFPGHFLVRLTGEHEDLLLDPYRRGMSVHPEDCRRMLIDLSGGKLEFSERHIASIGKRDMVARLLMNLKGAYLRSQQDEHALAAVERLLLLHPEDLDELRDRGLLLYRLSRYRPALEALETYLEARPDAEDRERIAAHAAELRDLIERLN